MSDQNIEDTAPLRITQPTQKLPPEEPVSPSEDLTQTVPVSLVAPTPTDDSPAAGETPVTVMEFNGETGKMNMIPPTENTIRIQRPPESPKKTRPRRWFWVVIGIVLILVGGGFGGFAGYQSGLQSRLAEQQSKVAIAATTQFQLGVIDLAAKRYEIARKRFEYVIKLDPAYPGAAQKLAEAMVAMARVDTPTPAPSATLTPTKDTRGQEELFNQVRILMANKDWNRAIDTMDAIRQADSTYRAIQVDGLYYVSLRNRGMEKILNGKLEEGIYDMALTERFGPLDKDANTYRNWARYYLSGASYWGLDWAQVVQIFSEIYPSLPNLRDGSGMTAVERFRIASIKYGDQLLEKEKYCEASDQYANALAIVADKTTAPKATQAYGICHPAQPTSAFTPTPTIAAICDCNVDPKPPCCGVVPTATPETPVPPPPVP